MLAPKSICLARVFILSTHYIMTYFGALCLLQLCIGNMFHLVASWCPQRYIHLTCGCTLFCGMLAVPVCSFEYLAILTCSIFFLIYLKRPMAMACRHKGLNVKCFQRQNFFFFFVPSRFLQMRCDFELVKSHYKSHWHEPGLEGLQPLYPRFTHVNRHRM